MRVELDNCDYGDKELVVIVRVYSVPDDLNIKTAIELLPQILGLLFAVNDNPYVQYNIQFWREVDKILKKIAGGLVG